MKVPFTRARRRLLAQGQHGLGRASAGSQVRLTADLTAGHALGVKTIALAGGVSANRSLRRELRARGEAQGFRVLVPPMAYCTDNAAMIAAAAFYRGDRARVAPEALRADPNFAW